MLAYEYPDEGVLNANIETYLTTHMLTKIRKRP
jgi:hypothetical protein